MVRPPVEVWEELGKAYFLHFAETNDLESLNMSIDYYEQVLAILPNRLHSLRSAGKAYAARWQRRGDSEDIRMAMLKQQGALQLYDLSRPSKAVAEIMWDLAMLWVNYFEQTTRNPNLISTAIDYLDYVLDYTTRTKGDVVPVKLRLAEAYLLRCDVTMVDGDHDSVRKLVREIRCSTDPHSHLRALLILAECETKDHQYDLAFDIYKEAMAAQEDLIVRKPSLRNLMEQLCVGDPYMRARDFPAAAFEAALDAKKPEAALRLLERSRALLLGQLERYRVHLGELDIHHSDLADRFRCLSSELEQSSVRGSQAAFPGPRLVRALARHKHKALADEWISLKEQIELLGFSTLFDPPSFAELQTTADEGPVITLNIGPRASCAFVLMPATTNCDHRYKIISLPNAPRADLQRLGLDFNHVLLGNSRSDEQQEYALKQLLGTLWSSVVEPITKDLLGWGFKPGSRLWWNPTGPACALPLHAACTLGFHNMKKVPYISSYIPNVRALLRARHTSYVGNPGTPRLLVVTHPEGQGEEYLHGVDEEHRSLSCLKDEYNHKPTMLHKDLATPDRVVKAMRCHPWVHISCHGSVDVADPFRTHFCLGNERLNLIDLLNPESCRAGSDFAFLSVCNSAGANAQSPDERLHLAAGMMLAGCRSVIATMYPARDDRGAKLAERFYKNMGFRTDPDERDILSYSMSRLELASGRCLDVKDAAFQLHRALGAVSNGVTVPQYAELCTYVHYGI